MKTDIAINPAGNDIVSNFLMSLKGKRLFTTLLTAIGLTIIPVLFTIVDGTFINSQLTADVIHDIGKISVYLIGLPTAILILSIYSGKFPMVLEQLKQNKVIVMTDNEWRDFKLVANIIFAKKFFTKTPHLLAFLITLFLIYISIKFPVWYSVKIENGFYFAAYLQIPVYYLTFYTFAVCLFNIIACYVVLRKLFNNYKISLQPLHPDNCGGLSALGALSQKLNIGIVLIGIISGLNVYMDYKLFGDPMFNTFRVLIVVGYIICAYIVFFMPLYAAHESMKDAKFEEIQRINEYFMAVNQKLKDRLNSHENIDQRDMDDFENVNKMYELARKMPVYPFNVATVSSFIGSIFIPVILFILEKVFEKLFS